MLKPSRFNHFQPWKDGYYIAYNGFTATVALITEEDYNKYKRLFEASDQNPMPDDLKSAKELSDQLEFGHFVCHEDFDEMAELQFQHLLGKYDQTILGMAFAPTMACNLACKYCYEANKVGRMSEDVIEAATAFVEAKAPNIKRLDISWYGGEPLLAMDLIDKISRKLLKIADIYHLDYGTGMITNGYLLTPETVNRLLELKITSAQVSLDGPAYVHDVRRPQKNGQGSFDRIFDNVCHAADRMEINLRINTDKNLSKEDVCKLLDQLISAGLRKKISVQLGQVNVSTPVCAGIADHCYNTPEFADIEVEYYRILAEKGFKISRVPHPKSILCLAQTFNSFLIDPDGDIYKCYLHPGDKSKSMGNIRHKINYQHPNFTRMFKIDPFDEGICKDCDFLPTCLGGCPSRRVHPGHSGEELCPTWKHNLADMLDIVVSSRYGAMTASPADPNRK